MHQQVPTGSAPGSGAVHAQQPQSQPQAGGTGTGAGGTGDVVETQTQHRGPLHDAQLDYYGRRLATCAADAKVCVWDVAPL